MVDTQEQRTWVTGRESRIQEDPRNLCLRKVKRLANKYESVAVWANEKGIKHIDVYEKTFTMSGVAQPL